MSDDEPPPSDRPTGPPSGPLSGPSRPGPATGPPSGAGEGDTGRGTHEDGGHDDTIAADTGGGAYGPGGPGGPGGSGTGPGGPDRGSGEGPGGPDGPEGPGGPTDPKGPGEGEGKGPQDRGAGDARPWWHSAPRIALMTGATVAAVVLIIVFTRPSGSGGSKGAGSEVFLQAAGKDGPEPFTPSTARTGSPPPSPPSLPNSSTSASANVTRGVDGSAPGLYGGTRNVASCDVEKQITALGTDPAKTKAFASVLGITPGDVPRYLRALTPVQLRVDTRVTNHGYRDGSPTAYQAVLQAGTAVLVDDRGVPRVRCACGNPLTPPVAQQGTPKPTGDSWPAYRPSNVAVVAPSTQVVDVFVMFDPDHNEWFQRYKGDKGGGDKKTTPPSQTYASPSASPPCSPYPSPSAGAPTPCAPTAVTSAPPSESNSPSTEAPSTSPGTPTPYEPATTPSASAPGGY
ncbi:DUF6777 domain-containing protein [Streptomyces sp. CBMA152]|uniref:DUF6777 domain-containing protein n=1 Tax=Streptomyces sp. CBMA152 TaxID=1896312 RepID=UPI001660D5E3|nr:DUF6777 domain-containing protein [Streptomyces sp. CBMA152]MBD0743759.1 hypothetical protein [Streptomyces sp. CBMA152]